MTCFTGEKLFTGQERPAPWCIAPQAGRDAPGGQLIAAFGGPSTHFHNSTATIPRYVGRSCVVARQGARPAVMRVITRVGQRRRRPRKAALRVAFPAPSGRREHSAMPRHRLRAPSRRGNRKRDPTCRGIVPWVLGSRPAAFRSLPDAACIALHSAPHGSASRVHETGQYLGPLV